MGSIRLKTEVPGPLSRQMSARRAAAVSGAVANATGVAVARAEGALVHDADGNILIDMAGGIGMLAAGHCNPQVVRAMQQQAEALIHFCAILGTYEPYVRVCELLNESTPGDFAKKSILANSGAEAVENAVKFARTYTGRPGVIVFEGAYHGRTLLTLSMTSKWSLFKKGFGPYASEIHRLPIPNLYRKPEGMSDGEYLCWSLRQFDHQLVAQVDPSAVACIVIEPVQGEAGFLPVPEPFMNKIREICDKHGIVMIADEIQCGMGRTGKLWASEHYPDATPDLLVSGKSLASGMPLAAVTGRAEIMDAVHVGGAGGTYGGAPLACAAAVQSIEQIRTPEFLRMVNEKGAIMARHLEAWHGKYPLVGNVRGLGAMRLAEFVLDRETKEPAPQHTLDIIKESVARGLILIRAGLYANGIRLLPPLVITDEQLEEALGVIDQAISVVQERTSATAASHSG